MDAEDDIIQNSCSFRNIQYVKEPTISGKIVDVLPLSKKSRMQSTTVLTIHCIDVSPGESKSTRRWKVLILDEAAEKVWSLKPAINDYIAFRKAVAIQDTPFRNSEQLESKMLVIRPLLGYKKRVLFKKNKEVWASLKSHLCENDEKEIPPNTNVRSTTERTEEIVCSNGITSPTRNEANDWDLGIISSTNWIVAKKTPATSQAPLNEPNHNKSEASNASQLNKTPSRITPSKENRSQKLISPPKKHLKIRSPETLMQNIVCKNISNRNATSVLKFVYTKLANIKANMTVNIIGIVLSVPSEPFKSSDSKFCQFIYIVDDSMPEEFTIRIFYNREEDRPILQQYCVILCREVKISRGGRGMYGKIVDCRKIVTFDKDDIKICYKQSSDFTLTPEDEERAERLRNWMFESIPNSRPFKPLASIACRNDTVNLRCQIVDVKGFDKNIIMLRLEDGTTCEFPSIRVPFECESWHSACAEMKSNHGPSKEIDVIIQAKNSYLYKKFLDELKAGFTVELFNVSLYLLPNPTHTKQVNSLKAYLEGWSHNIRVVEKSDKPSLTKRAGQPSFGKKPRTVRRIKRKLLGHSPIPEYVDSDVSDFENSLDMAVASPKKSKSVAEFKNPKSVGSKTSSASLTAANNSDNNAVKDVLPKDNNLKPSETKSNDEIQTRDLISETNSSIAVQESHSTKVVESNNQKSVGSKTLSVSLIAANNSNNNTVKDVLPKDDNFQPSESESNDKIQTIDLESETNTSLVIKESNSIEYISITDSDSPLDSVSLPKNAHEEVASKSVSAHLHQSIKFVVASERKAIQKKLTDYITVNDVSNYLVQWPSDPGDEAFYIQVTIMSTIPFINAYSSDFELLALIRGYCNRCDSFFPYYLAKWIVSDDDGPVNICPKCKENDIMSPLKHELVCELLLSDDFGNSVPAMVMSHHAENFFGCTVSQLCSSVEAQIRVRTFIDGHMFAKGKEKKPLIMKLIRIYSTKNNVYKYHILS